MNKPAAHSVSSLMRVLGIALATVVFIALVALLGWRLGPWSSGRACTAMGCFSGLSLTLDWPLAVERLDGAHAEYCHNGRCAAGTLSVRVSKPPADVKLTVGVHGELVRTGERQPMAEVEVWLRAGQAPWLNFRSRHEPDERAGGDLYSVRVWTASGELVVDHDERVQAYQHSTPNGPDCPPLCKAASVDRRAARK